MRKSTAAAGVAAVAAMFAWTASAGSPPGPAQDRAFGGGSVTPGSCTDGASPFCSPASRDVSMLAVSAPQGGGAYGTVTFKTFTARVTCLAVAGNEAEIGGVVVEAADPALVGDEYRVFVRDGGGPGSAADGISPNFLDPPGAATCSDLGSDALGVGYFTLAHGDVVVEDR
jgi:hypothetical protein